MGDYTTFLFNKSKNPFIPNNFTMYARVTGIGTALYIAVVSTLADSKPSRVTKLLNLPTPALYLMIMWSNQIGPVFSIVPIIN
jgi:hypothetical protein